jgi:hypothetical protein
MAFAVDSDVFQIYLTSDGCLDKFPENKPSHFKISLKNPKEFRSPNNKYSVGLARFGYDSALYNLGPNTGTFIEVFVNDQYYKIETLQALVSTTDEAVFMLNKSIDSFATQNKIAELNTKINFSAKSKSKIELNLSEIDDFAMSPMLIKLLGFHEYETIGSDQFDFRKKSRDFLSEISNSETLLDDLEAIETKYPSFITSSTESLFQSALFSKQSTFTERNEYMKQFQLNVERFFHMLNQDLSSILQNLIQFNVGAFDKFVNNNFYKIDGGDQTVRNNYSFFSSEEKKNVTISFESRAIIEFLIHSVARMSLRFYQKLKINSLESKSIFNPQLFNCLYIYSNLVETVDFNDGKYRLLDIVFLKKSSEFQPGVAEYQSTHFKKLEHDSINEIEIQVTTSLGTPAPFIHGPVFVVLEFRK